MTIIQQLKEQKDFTDTEIRLAEYMIENHDDISNLGIQQLANSAYCSHSAVVRLVKKLGFSGFKEFKIAWIKEIQDRLYEINGVDPNFPFRQFDSSYDIAKQIADLCIDSIQKTVQLLSKETLEDVAKLIINSNRVFLFATGDSQIRARSFQNKFNKINRYPIIADEYGEAQWSALNLLRDDVAIFISYSGKSDNYERYIKYCNRKNIPTVVLTSNLDSKMAQLSNKVIGVPSGESDIIKVATFASQISFEYILDTLFSIIYSHDYTKNIVSVSDKEKMMNKNLI